jgi:hypothetical protein
MPASYPTEDDLRRALETRVGEFGKATGMTASNIGTHAINDAAAIGRIVVGENFKVETYSRLMTWMESNWPRPEGIATPDTGFEVLKSVAPRRLKELRISISYQGKGGGKSRNNAHEGEWMAPEPRLLVGLPIFAMREWPYDDEQLFSFARGALKARILIAETGMPLVRLGYGGGRINFGFVPALGHDNQPKEWMPFRRLDPEKEGGAVIEIDSPAWLRAAS